MYLSVLICMTRKKTWSVYQPGNSLPPSPASFTYGWKQKDTLSKNKYK